MAPERASFLYVTCSFGRCECGGRRTAILFEMNDGNLRTMSIKKDDLIELFQE
jgi:hypothetical protein